MDSSDGIVDVALRAVANGIDTFPALLEHCLVHTGLGSLAASDGVTAAQYFEWELEESALIDLVGDGRIVRIDTLIDGAVFTHRVTPEEVEASVLELVPDLSAIDTDEVGLKVGGGTLVLDFPTEEGQPFEHGFWKGPAGWLEGISAGDLIALRRRGSEIEITVLAEVDEGTLESVALEAAFEEETDGRANIAVEPSHLIRTALVNDPELFRHPVRPIRELLESVGIEVDGAWVGRSGEEWERPGESMTNEAYDQIVERHDLAPCCVAALDVVIEEWNSFLRNETIDIRKVNRSLGHSATVHSFAEWTDRLFGLHSQLVDRFATALAEGDRHDTAPALMLRSLHHDAFDDPLAAERDLERAVILDPEYVPALLELARYTTDRGDAPRTAALLRKAGLGEDEPLLSFHAHLGVDMPTVGRNEPCPCGSGRKYKQCHLGKPQVSPEQRVKWLMLKLSRFIARPSETGALVALAVNSDPVGDWNTISERLSDEFIAELRVFEDGGASDYREARGPLLPDDEIDVLDLWAMTRLTLWEVTAGTSDVMTLRDTRTGESVEVRDRTASQRCEPGDQLLARVLPGWGSNWLSAAVLPINPYRRDGVISMLDTDPTAGEIAEWYGYLMSPPTIHTTDGDPLVAQSARFRPSFDWEDLSLELDELYDRDEGAIAAWHFTRHLGEDEDLVLARLFRDGDELVVETLSDSRMHAVIRELGGSVELIEISDGPAVDPPAADPPESTPELDDELIEKLRDKMERRWIDENVPALGGLTPRQAAADPTRREDLLSLLRSFERMTPPSPPAFGMRPDILRRHLDLD